MTTSVDPPPSSPVRVLELDQPLTETMLVASGEAIYVGVSGGRAQGGGAVLRSDDDGETWERLVPQDRHGSALRGSMGTVTVDASGRLLASSCGDPTVEIEGPWAEKIARLTSGGSTLSDSLAYSDDRGDSWTVVRGAFPHGGDWGKTFTGPPATDRGRARLEASGRDAVVYHCAGATYSCVDYCWRSFDGGKSWELTAAPVFNSYIGNTPLPYGERPATPAGGDRSADQHTLGGIGVVLATGEILVPANVCGRPMLYRSRDEGDSWLGQELPDVAVRTKRAYDGIDGFQFPPNAGRPLRTQQPFHRLYGPTAISSLWSQQLALGSDGALHLAWVDARDELVHLTSSRDGGISWSDRRCISAPDLDMTCTSSIATGPDGMVAVSYYGSDDGGWSFDGHVVIADDDPEVPLRHARTTGRPLQPNGISEPIEYTGCDIDDRGVVWASFARDHATIDPRSPAVQADGTFDYDGTDRFTGVVLRWGPARSDVTPS